MPQANSVFIDQKSLQYGLLEMFFDKSKGYVGHKTSFIVIIMNLVKHYLIATLIINERTDYSVIGNVIRNKSYGETCEIIVSLNGKEIGIRCEGVRYLFTADENSRG